MELKKILEITEELVSFDARKVIEYLYSNPGASEFDISEEISLSVAKIRSLLYELKAKNLIDYDRKKDKEKGWYLYYWKVSVENYEKVFRSEKSRNLENFEERLEKEENQTFYICPNYCKRLSFEDSLEINFSCPVCSSIMQEENKERKIQMLKRNIEEHKKILNY